jgi:hypothetical protein
VAADRRDLEAEVDRPLLGEAERGDRRPKGGVDAGEAFVDDEGEPGRPVAVEELPGKAGRAPRTTDLLVLGGVSKVGCLQPLSRKEGARARERERQRERKG